jgi:uncharacterized membrane protein
MKRAIFYIIITSIILFIIRHVLELDASVSVIFGSALAMASALLLEFIFHFYNIVRLDIKSYKKIRKRHSEIDYSFDRHLKMGHAMDLVNEDFYETYI